MTIEDEEEIDENQEEIEEIQEEFDQLEENNKTDDTIASSAIKVKYERIIIPEDNIKEIEKILESSNFSDNEKYIINNA